MSRVLAWLGIGLTVFYIVVLHLLFVDGRFAELKGMPLNNLGDFLAGVFGPIAILWLILGFFQQGIELKQNTRMLELQANELKASVEQQRELVDVSRKQVQAEIDALQAEQERQRVAARAALVFEVFGRASAGGLVQYDVCLRNLGAPITRLTFESSPDNAYQHPLASHSIAHGGFIDFSIQVKEVSLENKPEELKVTYCNSLNFEVDERFVFVFSDTGFLCDIKPKATQY
jgi:DNA-binding transcriptional MerR regulator